MANERFLSPFRQFVFPKQRNRLLLFESRKHGNPFLGLKTKFFSVSNQKSGAVFEIDAVNFKNRSTFLISSYGSLTNCSSLTKRNQSEGKQLNKGSKCFEQTPIFHDTRHRVDSTYTSLRIVKIGINRLNDFSSPSQSSNGSPSFCCASSSQGCSAASKS